MILRVYAAAPLAASSRGTYAAKNQHRAAGLHARVVEMPAGVEDAEVERLVRNSDGVSAWVSTVMAGGGGGISFGASGGLLAKSEG